MINIIVVTTLTIIVLSALVATATIVTAVCLLHKASKFQEQNDEFETWRGI